MIFSCTLRRDFSLLSAGYPHEGQERMDKNQLKSDPCMASSTPVAHKGQEETTENQLKSEILCATADA